MLNSNGNKSIYNRYEIRIKNLENAVIEINNKIDKLEERINKCTAGIDMLLNLALEEKKKKDEEAKNAQEEKKEDKMNLKNAKKNEDK